MAVANESLRKSTTCRSTTAPGRYYVVWVALLVLTRRDGAHRPHAHARLRAWRWRCSSPP